MKNENRYFNLILVFYLILFLVLVIYSFTQIDLNLTLSSNPFYQNIQNQLIQIGYFKRPLSASIFLLVIFSLFSLYLIVLKKVQSKEINQRRLRWLVGLSALLLFGYPAFSHDIFNYMFDARIVTKYHLSPYFLKGLDFPADPWVRFMHWTHRYYPYGPGWLWLSLIPSYLGLGKFVLTLLLFKFMFLVFHLANCRLIQKILEKIAPHEVNIGIALFALNPLVIIESILSPHNEAVMLTFVLLGIYFLLNNKNALAIISLALSATVKFVGGVLIPVSFFWKEKISDSFLKWAFYLWLVALIPIVLKRELLSWYFIPVAGLASLTPVSLKERAITIGLSAATLVRYFPFLFFGEYGTRTTTYEQWGMGLTFILFSTATLFLWRKS